LLAALWSTAADRRAAETGQDGVHDTLEQVGALVLDVLLVARERVRSKPVHKCLPELRFNINFLAVNGGIGGDPISMTVDEEVGAKPTALKQRKVESDEKGDVSISIRGNPVEQERSRIIDVFFHGFEVVHRKRLHSVQLGA
jgi:hypothetical protein